MHTVLLTPDPSLGLTHPGGLPSLSPFLASLQVSLLRGLPNQPPAHSVPSLIYPACPRQAISPRRWPLVSRMHPKLLALAFEASKSVASARPSRSSPLPLPTRSACASPAVPRCPLTTRGASWRLRFLPHCSSSRNVFSLSKILMKFHTVHKTAPCQPVPASFFCSPVTFILYTNIYILYSHSLSSL